MSLHDDLFTIFMIIFITLSAALLTKRLLLFLGRLLTKTQTTWDEMVINAVSLPMQMSIWVIGISMATKLAFDDGTELYRSIAVIRTALLIIAVAWFLIRLIRMAVENIITRQAARGETPDVTSIDAMAKVLRIAIIITTVLVVMQNLGVNISGLLAFGGIGGLAIGLAAKDMLANFFGGLMIYLDRPFKIGDWIRSPDREVEGVVEEIGWRQTRIRNFDSRPLYVPNAAFSMISVENPSRMLKRKIYETVGIRYDDLEKMNSIVADIISMLKEHPKIDSDDTMIIGFNRFSASSLDILLYCFAKATSGSAFILIKQDVLLKVAEIIGNHDAEIAFPTSVHYHHKVDQQIVADSNPEF